MSLVDFFKTHRAHEGGVTFDWDQDLGAVFARCGCGERTWGTIEELRAVSGSLPRLLGLWLKLLRLRLKLLRLTLWLSLRAYMAKLLK